MFYGVTVYVFIVLYVRSFIMHKEMTFSLCKKKKADWGDGLGVSTCCEARELNFKTAESVYRSKAWLYVPLTFF